MADMPEIPRPSDADFDIDLTAQYPVMTYGSIESAVARRLYWAEHDLKEATERLARLGNAHVEVTARRASCPLKHYMPNESLQELLRQEREQGRKEQWEDAKFLCADVEAEAQLESTKIALYEFQRRMNAAYERDRATREAAARMGER